jgi:hypothetical protein
LDNILSMLHNNKLEFIICGDVNINYLKNCDIRQLGAFLNTFNLIGTAKFLTWIVMDSKTVIDNIVMDFLKASLGILAPALCNNSGYVILAGRGLLCGPLLDSGRRTNHLACWLWRMAWNNNTMCRRWARVESVSFDWPSWI